MLIRQGCLLGFDNLALGISMRSSELEGKKKGQGNLSLYFDTLKATQKPRGSFCRVTYSLHQGKQLLKLQAMQKALHCPHSLTIYIMVIHSSKHFSKHFKNQVVSIHTCGCKYSAAGKWSEAAAIRSPTLDGYLSLNDLTSGSARTAQDLCQVGPCYRQRALTESDNVMNVSVREAAPCEPRPKMSRLWMDWSVR